MDERVKQSGGEEELLRSRELLVKIEQVLKNATEDELKMVLQYIKPLSK